MDDVESHTNWQAFREWIAKVGFGACWSVPILSPSNIVLGTLAIYHRDKRKPNDEERELMLALADVAALAMEHANFVQKLKQSNTELEQFAYVASHDLREPLRMVHSFCGLLKERYAGRFDTKADQYLHYAMDGATRMKLLIDHLLSYSRLGEHSAHLTAMSLTDSLDRAICNLQTKIEETKAEIEIGQLPWVIGDATRLTQLFQNLLDNAIKFRRELTPRISIHARPLGKNWEITVQDNGLGIEPQYYQRVFEIFQRLHSREEYPGVGMGMAICKRIVEGHGGAIWLDSQLGKGTAVRFTLFASEFSTLQATKANI